MGQLADKELLFPDEIDASVYQTGYTFKQGTYKTKDTKELKTYNAFRVLGQGSFGMVYLASNNNKELVAVKSKLFLNDYHLMNKSHQFFRGELEALFNLKHVNIVRLLGAQFEFNDVSSLIMEYLPGETLDKYIYKNKQLSEKTIKIFTRQTVDAVSYIHSKLVMHRDIKSSNIILISRTWIKLIDFGMAKRLYADDIGFSLSTSTMVGTVPFMAPEVRNFQSYNCKADIFSIGALIWDMANGDPYVRIKNNYNLMTETMILSQFGGPLNITTLSETANSFMQYCLIRDANSRPSANNLLEHPFIKNVTIPKQKAITHYSLA